MEDHHRAYHIWKEASVKDRILVHIDAHLDFAWFSQDNPLNILEAETLKDMEHLIETVPVWNPSPSIRDRAPDIGNYICSAIRDGIVREFFWLVPDDFLDKRWKFNYWERYIRGILKEIPKHKSCVMVEGRRIRTRFYNCPVTMCTVRDMPLFYGEPVLLDIDTDFFLTDFAAQQNIFLLQIKKRLPWMWPQELVGILKEKGLEPDLITIAYSVEKYFTPLEFKYLGDELKVFLSGQSVSDAIREGFELRNMAQEYLAKTKEVIQCLKENKRLKE